MLGYQGYPLSKLGDLPRGDPVLYSRANGVGQIYDLSRLLPSVDHIVHLSNPPLALAVLGLMKLP